MRVIEVSARKGGVGTTTSACAIASVIAGKGEKVLLVDTTGTDDAFAVCGMAIPVQGVPSAATPNLSVVSSPITQVPAELLSAHDVIVVDAGVNREPGQEYWGVKPYIVSVIRNAYLSLKAEVARPHSSDMVLVVVDDKFALTYNDAVSVVGPYGEKFIQVLHSYDLARAVDAGLFLMRSHTYEWAKEFEAINA